MYICVIFIFFVWSDLEKFIITSLDHQCCEWVPSEWVQTADKKITRNSHNASPSINVLWSEKLHVCKHFYKKVFLTSNCCFMLKYKSSIHNIAFCSEKALSSESGERYAQMKHCLQVTRVQNVLLDFDMSTHHILEEALLWIILPDFGHKYLFKFKMTVM